MYCCIFLFLSLSARRVLWFSFIGPSKAQATIQTSSGFRQGNEKTRGKKNLRSMHFIDVLYTLAVTIRLLNVGLNRPKKRSQKHSKRIVNEID